MFDVDVLGGEGSQEMSVYLEGSLILIGTLIKAVSHFPNDALALCS